MSGIRKFPLPQWQSLRFQVPSVIKLKPSCSAVSRPSGYQSSDHPNRKRNLPAQDAILPAVIKDHRSFVRGGLSAEVGKIHQMRRGPYGSVLQNLDAREGVHQHIQRQSAKGMATLVGVSGQQVQFRSGKSIQGCSSRRISGNMPACSSARNHSKEVEKM